MSSESHNLLHAHRVRVGGDHEGGPITSPNFGSVIGSWSSGKDLSQSLGELVSEGRCRVGQSPRYSRVNGLRITSVMPAH